jgi:hypothetical protein
MKENLKNGLFLLLVCCVVVGVGVKICRDFFYGETPVIVVKKAELQASSKGPFYYSGKARISGAMNANVIQDSAKFDPVYNGNADMGGGRNDDAGPGPKSDLDLEMYVYTDYDVPAESDNGHFDEPSSQPDDWDRFDETPVHGDDDVPDEWIPTSGAEPDSRSFDEDPVPDLFEDQNFDPTFN